MRVDRRKAMRALRLHACGIALMAGVATEADACGAYFARQVPANVTGRLDTKLYNRSTRTVYARVGDETTVTMVADYRGNPREFAAVIAVPTVLTREQIKTVDAKLVERIDAATTPRFTISRDPDPCFTPSIAAAPKGAVHSRSGAMPLAAAAPRAAPVVVEARYLVGDYDVAILSATQSDGLLKWLASEGYQVPSAAEPVLAGYIAEGLKFFVAKVALKEGSGSGYKKLAPLQISYRSPKMWLPLRLSTVIAEGPQDMFVFALTDGAHIEAANVPTQIIDTEHDLPAFVGRQFGAFYEAAVAHAHQEAKGAVAIVEARQSFVNGAAASRSWNLSPDDLTALGIDLKHHAGRLALTRLHVRYDRSFTSDLVFERRADARLLSSSFRVHQPFEGKATCPAAADYRAQVTARLTKEIAALQGLTGWSSSEIARRGGISPQGR
jgi:hypothetical protein